MTDRVFQDASSFEVSNGGRFARGAEFYVFGTDKSLKVSVEDDRTYSFTLTTEEATMLKEFLISKGY